MYSPPHFRNEDSAELVAFVRAHGFGMLVAHGQQGMMASHLPFLLKEEGENLLLTCHVAAANGLASLLAQGQEVMAAFLGPHAYISSRWYDHLNVPTWNYVAVHVHGIPSVVNDDDLKFQDICELVDHYEPDAAHAQRMRDLPDRFRKSHLDALTAVRIQVTRMEGAWKLSQNRDAQNHARIVAELEKSSSAQDRAVAEEMRRRGPLSGR